MTYVPGHFYLIALGDTHTDADFCKVLEFLHKAPHGDPYFNMYPNDEPTRIYVERVLEHYTPKEHPEYYL